MMRYPELIPECNVDTAFVEMLGYPEPNHASHIHQVYSILDKKKADITCIGFIDNDKKKPAYIAAFKLVDKYRSKYISVLQHVTKNQFLVVAMPAMDRVIYNLCADLKIDVSQYGFPKEFKAFMARTKREAIKRDKGFKNLLNTLKQKNPQEIEMVRSLISKYF